MTDDTMVTGSGADRALATALAAQEQGLLTCVHCGFCLPACPTYGRLGDENDSPRGRLYLMRAVVEGRLAPDADAFTTHIDRCLGCRACEPVCPSGVRYGFLLERARDVIARERGIDRLARASLRVFGSRSLTRLVSLAGRMARAGGMARMLARALPRSLARVRFAAAMVAATAPHLTRGGEGARGRGGETARGREGEGARGRGGDRARGRGGEEATEGVGEGASAELAGRVHPRRDQDAAANVGGRRSAVGGRRPKAAILRGCVQQGLFSRVNAATVEVLEANGCEAVEVGAEVCCGALHAHNGDLEGARRLARANVRAFMEAGADVVVVNAAGCGAMMKEYGELLEDEPELAEPAGALASRVRDLFEYLAELGPVTGGPLHLRATLDLPCHLVHGQGIAAAPADVLAAIPGLELVPLPLAEECCGGAGIYGMTHPDLGGRILGDKLDAIRSTGADVVLTPNPGCHMQIGAGLVLDGSRVGVMHPVELLAESYRRRTDDV